MRVLHVPYSFPPDPAGGTEIYVEGLARMQRLAGCDAAVAAPSAQAAKYEYGGIPVWRFASSPELGLRDLYGEGDPVAAAGFAGVLDEFGPDIVHLHAVTSAVSVRLAAEAVNRRIPLLVNYHTPTVSCMRGTLLRWGTEICDGTLNATLCAACTLTGKGISRPVASLIAAIPSPVRNLLAERDASGGVWTALRMRELTSVRIAAFERMIGMADRVVALCEWTRALLLRNRIPPEKIVLCRQGIVWEPDGAAGTYAPPPATPLRLAFFGRFDPTKGAHVVVEALRIAGELPLQLDLYGVTQGDVAKQYAADLRRLIGESTQIRLLPPVSAGDVIPALRNYHALVVPSQWLETGPLVVLEAFAAGIPVIGSDLGGVAELVRDGVDGLLVRPYSSAGAWAEALRRICREPGLLGSWRAAIRPPRHSRETAHELFALYDEVAGRLLPGINRQ